MGHFSPSCYRRHTSSWFKKVGINSWRSRLKSIVWKLRRMYLILNRGSECGQSYVQIKRGISPQAVTKEFQTHRESFDRINPAPKGPILTAAAGRIIPLSTHVFPVPDCCSLQSLRQESIEFRRRAPATVASKNKHKDRGPKCGRKGKSGDADCLWFKVI